MSESKTPTAQQLRLNAEKLKHECSFVDWEEFAIFLVQVNENVRSQLTTAQQDLAKIAKALKTQQQRYHDLSEEVEGLKRVIVKVDDLLRRIEETRWGHDGCCGVTFIANEARQTIDDCSAMKGTK